MSKIAVWLRSRFNVKQTLTAYSHKFIVNLLALNIKRLNLMLIEDIKQKIVNFYDFSESEEENILKEIRDLALKDKPQFIEDVRNHYPQFDMSGIEVIYEALSDDPEKWGDFFAEEFKRAFADAKNSFQAKEILRVLEDISLMEKVNYPFAGDIIKVLAENIHSNIETIQYFALYYLADWLDDGNGAKQFALLKTLNDFVLTHPKRKVRLLAHYALRMSGNIPNTLKLRLKDKIISKFNNPLNFI